MKEIVFFSQNNYKIKEVQKILQSKKFKVLTLADFHSIDEPEEDGNSFKENAMIKSNCGYNSISLPCFADDSGICISALNNKPGIYTNRFQQENGGYKKTFKMIINKVRKEKNFKAFFKTSIALTINKQKTICFEGVVDGRISIKPLGSHGFHYDPIFIPEGTNKTYAEMSPKEKNKVSHRAKALNKLKKFLENSSY